MLASGVGRGVSGSRRRVCWVGGRWRPVRHRVCVVVHACRRPTRDGDTADDRREHAVSICVCHTRRMPSLLLFASWTRIDCWLLLASWYMACVLCVPGGVTRRRGCRRGAGEGFCTGLPCRVPWELSQQNKGMSSIESCGRDWPVRSLFVTVQRQRGSRIGTRWAERTARQREVHECMHARLTLTAERERGRETTVHAAWLLLPLHPPPRPLSTATQSLSMFFLDCLGFTLDNLKAALGDGCIATLSHSDTLNCCWCIWLSRQSATSDGTATLPPTLVWSRPASLCLPAGRGSRTACLHLNQCACTDSGLCGVAVRRAPPPRPATRAESSVLVSQCPCTEPTFTLAASARPNPNRWQPATARPAKVVDRAHTPCRDPPPSSPHTLTSSALSLLLTIPLPVSCSKLLCSSPKRACGYEARQTTPYLSLQRSLSPLYPLHPCRSRRPHLNNTRSQDCKPALAQDLAARTHARTRTTRRVQVGQQRKHKHPHYPCT